MEFFFALGLYIDPQSRKFDAPQHLNLKVPSERTQERAFRGLLPPPPRQGSSPPHLPKGGAERDRVSADASNPAGSFHYAIDFQILRLRFAVRRLTTSLPQTGSYTWCKA